MLSSLRKRLNGMPLEVKVSVSYAVCSILQKCLSFITLPLFTRLLTVEQYGQYTIYSSWYGILIIFLTFNLAYGSFQTAMIKYENRRSEYISSIQGICLLLTFIFLIIYIPFRENLNKLFELPTFFILIMVSDIFFSNSTQLWMERKRFEFKYKTVILITLLISFASPILAYILVVSSLEKGYARILGYALIKIIIGLVIFIVNIKNCNKLFSKELWNYALSFNIPLLIYYFSQSIFNQSDRIMISHMIGTTEAAMYGVAYNLAMILTFVLNSINNSYVPWFYNKLKRNEFEDNKKVTVGLFVFLSVMILFVIWFAPEIIKIMAGEKYLSSIYVIAPVSMSLLLLFYSQLFINVEFYYEDKKMLIYGSIFSAILNIGLNYLLIPKYGIASAGYTTFLSYVFFVISNYFSMKKCLKDKNVSLDIFDYKSLFLAFIVFLILSFIGVAFYNDFIIRLIAASFVLVVAFIKRQALIDNYNRIRNK